MKYMTLIGLFALFLIFIFSISYYAESLKEIFNSFTGFSFFNSDSKNSEDFAVIISILVLGISVVYFLLKVVNEMIFALKK